MILYKMYRINLFPYFPSAVYLIISIKRFIFTRINELLNIKKILYGGIRFNFHTFNWFYDMKTIAQQQNTST